MSKYTPLADYLRVQPQDSVKLTFGQIDALVNGLPLSARNHDAWWANSRTKDGHACAHQWIAAGWKCQSIDRANGTAVFRRASASSSQPMQRFWWVNHKQTFKSEFEGGYIWSPKANKNGVRNSTYDNLTQVKPGDVVVSYADGQIKAVGVARQHYSEAVKPEAFGLTGANWANSGWLVPIEWTALSIPLSPKAHIDRIQPLLPKKNSPLQANGNGNQGCYLAAISSELGELVLDIAGVSSPDALRNIRDLKLLIEADVAEIKIQNSADIPETEKEQLIRARRGQGIFRQRALALESQCRLTGVNDQSFLIASHIKPWKDCANNERLDGNNGLMLAPHIDKLFDRGWISFSDNGDLLTVPGAEQVMKAWSIDPNKNVGEFHPEQCRYLDHHRNMVFRGTRL
ncbi:HNH endonuclease [Pseudomonas sp. TH05]|uniref:HNH endonuclease n=1 Tax=unclassified Pseudomonas TaxID=196821 RepID=UPI001912E7BD|nr:MULTISPECIES: HNH endonuclease [unclassified Pseudomonas]MBK5541553.1 HNH endonuclease [Pseudomonas sp. TH07]MBK5558168.1 HNH endonuclease [Pseudomonas sp. TH05]